MKSSRSGKGNCSVLQASNKEKDAGLPKENRGSPSGHKRSRSSVMEHLIGEIPSLMVEARQRLESSKEEPPLGRMEYGRKVEEDCGRESRTLYSS